MSPIIRRTSFGVAVTYRDGDYSNNLVGQNFESAVSKILIRFIIDLGANLRVKNKESNCYADALELREKATLLKDVQIDERQILSAVASLNMKYPEAAFELQIILGESEKLRFPVGINMSSDSLIMTVA